MIVGLRIEKSIVDQNLGWTKTRYTEGNCSFIIHANSTGPFAYEMKHADIVYAPRITLLPQQNGKMKILLNFQDVAVEWDELSRVKKALTEIDDFCRQCEAEGLFTIQNGTSN